MKYPHRPGFKARQTAKAAADSVAARAVPLRERVYQAVKAAGKAGLTADEAAERLGVSILAVRPRVSELAVTGHLVDTLERRVNAISKRYAVVWRARFAR